MTIATSRDQVIALVRKKDEIAVELERLRDSDRAIDAELDRLIGGDRTPAAKTEAAATVSAPGAAQVKASNAYSKLSLPETPMLFVEFHGSEAGVKEQSERFGEIASELGGGPFDWATLPEDRSRLWQARHDAYWAARAWRPGAAAFATDVCVPISRLAECVVETQRDVAAAGLVAPIVGHVGDGNFHLTILVADTAEAERAKALNERLIARAIAMDGTCTGEHGVGQGKMNYLAAEHGRATLEVMRMVKHALDPHGIMNPGKMVDFPSPSVISLEET